VCLSFAIAGALTMAGVSGQAPGLIRIFLIERPVGIERGSITNIAEGRRLDSEVEIVDRGTKLALTSTLTLAPDLTPRHFRAQGRSYRFVNVDAEVGVAGKTVNVTSRGTTVSVPLTAPFFPARSWAPVASRAWLIEYWERKGRPAAIAMLPGDADSRIVVTFRDSESVTAGGRTVRLRRYSVDGVVWGRETVWVDEQGAFAALVSRIHILPLEAVREDLVEALPALQASSIRDRMADLAAWNAGIAPANQGTFALVGARVVTGDDTAPIEDGTVIVRDGRIAAVGRRPAVTVPRGVTVIDLSGATIIPGLWDMHAHASQIEWAPAYLAAGVTTIRDMGGELRFLTAFRDAIAAGRGIGPRVELAGLVDGPGEGGFGTVIAATEGEGRAVVDRCHAAGFRQMKLYSLLQPAVVAAITARAHELKMTVTGHVPSALGLENAVLAGLDHVAHQPSLRGQPGTPEADRLIALLASKGTVVDPTQAWGELLGRQQDVAADQLEPGIARAPYALAENYRSVTNPPRAAAPSGAGPSVIKVLHGKGVAIVAGTDGAVPGFSLLRELELYVRAGLTPLQAIQSATVVPARALGLDKDSGRIAAGMRADLVILDANPLIDISALRRTRFVVSNGRMYSPAQLWPLAGFKRPGT
jgi:imidazolonepropionase-like amidohydrolase